MNLQSIYSDATGRTERAKKRLEESEIIKEQFVGLEPSSKAEPKEDAARQQVKVDWLQSTATQEMFKKLNEESEQHIHLAIQKANTYHQHGNHNEIVKLLIQAQTVKDIINNYGKSN